MCFVYASSEIGLFVVFVARNKAVNLANNIFSKLQTTQQSLLHHILWVPVHDRVFEVESLQIGNSRCLYLLWKAEEGA